MSRRAYPIAGGDYAAAGAASRDLKDALKKIAVAPDIVRRAVIAAYEAEMNVVIYAHQGVMEADIEPDLLAVEVRDEGPGIPDIGLAMQEGYSTAPPQARELGFGAGMGLPNIRKNADSFRIESTPGSGTRVRFVISLRAQEDAPGPGHALHVQPGRCRGCMACLKACPTGAIRVRNNGRPTPEVLSHLCIDCAACIAVCPAGALAFGAGEGLPAGMSSLRLLLPAPFLAQFPGVSPERAERVLISCGFHGVEASTPWEVALRAAVLDYARHEARQFPVISPACPAVANLIALRFPSLLGRLAPFLSPLEAATCQAGGERTAVAAPCPAVAALFGAAAANPQAQPVPLAVLGQLVMSAVAAGPDRPDPSQADQAPASAPEGEGEVVRMSGIREVVMALEDVEDGRAADLPVLEPYACPDGCFGSPLMKQPAAFARYRWEHRSGPAQRSVAGGRSAAATRRRAPHAPRRGMRLDADLARASEKISSLGKLARSLPGRDCGQCGAPTCGALAQDVVLGRVRPDACPHRENPGKGPQ